MLISNRLIVATAFGLVLGLVPTLPFDGTSSTEPMRPSPNEAFRSGIQNLKGGDKSLAAGSLQYAAEKGNELALWQLAHMYAKGNGVERDDYRAFEYFRTFADRNSNVNPASSRARYVADAFVMLGNYYMSGIPGSTVTASPIRAQRVLTHAAQYFGDPEAQYQLARLLFDNKGAGRDPRRAVKWLNHAANKRHFEAQAMLGRILFDGELGRSERASGLMWLIVAYDGPGANVSWIAELHESAFKQASAKERADALVLLERWVEGRRE